MTKVFYFELLRAVVKIIAESLSQHDEKHVVPTPPSGIRVGKRKNRNTTKLHATILKVTKLYFFIYERKNS
jgi:hypothetical protein